MSFFFCSEAILPLIEDALTHPVPPLPEGDSELQVRTVFIHFHCCMVVICDNYTMKGTLGMSFNSGLQRLNNAYTVTGL